MYRLQKILIGCRQRAFFIRLAFILNSNYRTYGIIRWGSPIKSNCSYAQLKAALPRLPLNTFSDLSSFIGAIY